MPIAQQIIRSTDAGFTSDEARLHWARKIARFAGLFQKDNRLFDAS